MVDKNVGVCDVILYQGSTENHLSQSAYDCVLKKESVTETMWHLSELAPLVGFHGEVDSEGIKALGLIFYDTLDASCRLPTTDSSEYTNMTEAEITQLIEAEISTDEKKRAQALENILIFDSLTKARQSNEDIARQIQELHQ